MEHHLELLAKEPVFWDLSKVFEANNSGFGGGKRRGTKDPTRALRLTKLKP